MKRTSDLKPLQTGQFWRLGGEERVHIVQVGKILAHFKHFKLKNQKRVPIQLMNIGNVQEFLKKNDAKLLKSIVE